MKGLLVCVALVILTLVAFGQDNGTTLESHRALVNGYCSSCHNDETKSGGFSFTELDLARPDKNPEQAERVIRKIRSGMMPPAGARRPEAAKLKAFAAGLEMRVDQAAAKQPYVDAPDL